MVVLEGLSPEDEAFVRDRIEAHLKETDSDLARRLLQDWATTIGRFVKVMPTDFKRVTEAARRAEERGMPALDAIMEAAHG
jgi:glutamate synthase (NADPH) large chain